jgi:hypothetical protein
MIRRALSPGRPCLAGFVAAAAALAATAAGAACPVTEFGPRPLASLNPVQRLAFLGQVTRTEFAVLKAAAPGDANYDPLVTGAADAQAARQAAQARIEALGVPNAPEYARFWALDWLSDEQQQAWVTCSARRRPGLLFAGRPAGPGVFDLTFAHYAPIGVEKLRLSVVASRNIANIAAFEALLDQLGLQENFPTRTFPLILADPGAGAVLVLRAGWETPSLVYIPSYPWPEVP